VCSCVTVALDVFFVPKDTLLAVSSSSAVNMKTVLLAPRPETVRLPENKKKGG
jgi:hypothetical protein